MGNKKTKTSLSREGTNFLKAIAIFSVLLIHILSSSKPSPFVNESKFQLAAIFFDQLARISVPLFVALSGYGLYCGYAKKKLELGTFFKRRVFKILPLYILWSGIFSALFYFVPSWGPLTQQPNLLWKIVLGRADYHLYFVPMVFQLYVFFPLILKVFKKWPLATLLGAVFVQLLWWWIFSYGGRTVTSWKYFAEDGEQYLWMTNWIAYFVLGMYLPKIWHWFDAHRSTAGLVLVGWLFSGGYAISNALQLIQNGTDPLFALKFTRYPLFFYSFLAILVSSYCVARAKHLTGWLVKVGKISYPLYLSHTLFLRIAFFLLYL